MSQHACHSEAPRPPGTGPRQLPAWSVPIGCGFYYHDALRRPEVAQHCRGCAHAKEARRAADKAGGGR